MKKIKFMAFIILLSMILNCILSPIISKAAEKINPAPLVDTSPIDVLKWYATIAATTDMDTDIYNGWLVDHCYNIAQAEENHQTVITATFERDLNNNLFDTTETFVYLSLMSLVMTGNSDDMYYEKIKSQFNNPADFEFRYKIVLSKDGTAYGTKKGVPIEGVINDQTAENLVNKYEISGNSEDAIYTEVAKIFGLNYNDYNKDATKFVNGCFENSIDDFELSIVANGKVYYLVFGYDSSKKVDNLGNEGTGGERYAFNWYFLTSFDELPDDSEFSTELEYEAYIGNKDVGGTIEDGTFLPNYDKDNIKEDADVTAIIKSTTDEDIAQVNEKYLNPDGTPNDEGWYYKYQDNKKVIAKIYPFEKYDNSTDNGMVTEKVTLTSSEGNTDEQTVSIKWPFRIIDVTYDPETPTDDTDEVTVTIETNLPMDPDKVPDGWTIVPNTDNHKITKTFKKGEDVNTDVTVYQNGTGDSDKTNIKYDWPSDDGKDNTVAPTKHPNTGETFTILLVIAILVSTAVIAKKKIKLKK